MPVQTKFKVERLEVYEEGATIYLEPVISGSVENDTFFKYTPAGQIELSLVNQELAASFIPGSEYYVTFEYATPSKFLDSD